MPVIKIRDVVFGEGLPKICLPEIETNKDDILNVIKKYNQKVGWDVLEVRLDFFNQLENINETINLLKDIRENTNKLVLATIRTIDEGGQVALSPENYLKIIVEICNSQYIDMIDVELSKGNACVSQAIFSAQKNNVKVVLSKHDFNQTPDNITMKKYLEKMEQLGGDFLKLAVMPLNKADVLRLLEVTNEISEKSSKPLITMSMGKLGEITRVSGESYGSVMTFATFGKASAPGQIPLENMIKIMQTLHNDK